MKLPSATAIWCGAAWWRISPIFAVNWSRPLKSPEPVPSVPGFLSDVDYQEAEYGTFFDELPLWSAPFGLLLLERVPLRPDLVILDVGAGTGFLTLELAQRCGRGAKVFAVDPWQAAMTRLRRKIEFLGLENVVLMEQDAARMDL